MIMSGLSQGNLVVFFRTIYDPPDQSFINFSNVDRQNSCGSSSPARNTLLPQPSPTREFSLH